MGRRILSSLTKFMFDMKKFLKQLLCNHKHSCEFVCWHPLHDPWSEPAHVEVQFQCTKCDKVFYGHFVPETIPYFREHYPDKEWGYGSEPIIK